MKENLNIFAAWFGAIGTFLLFFLELVRYIKDKPNLKITTKFNQEIFTDFGERIKKDKNLADVWTINIANNWKQSILIRDVFIENHKGKNAIIKKDSIGNPIQFQNIEPGRSFDIVISEQMLKSKNVRAIIVTSGVGIKFKKRIYFWEKK